MLEMDQARISFAQALKPPEGYKTAFVVGTTYTLDLRALLSVCIPLGLGFDPEALESINPVSLFAALQELQGKMVIFCDKGHINADLGGDAKSRGLTILLEDMIHQVHVNRWSLDKKLRSNGLSSFHPKVWIVEYVPQASGPDPKYRLLVMSRNLTFDSSWDVAVSIDGHQGIQNDCGEHLADFLEFLAKGDDLTSTEKDNTKNRDSHTRRILRLANAIRFVEFEVTWRDFDSVDFLPFGPRAQGKQTLLLDPYKSSLVQRRYKNLLIASPFLSEAKESPLQLFLEKRSGENGRFLLLSREDSLARLHEDMRSEFECYSPVSWLSDVELESDEGEAPDAARYSNLHAKLYFGEEYSHRHLYIGSLNASRNGMVNNVEALIHLEVRRRYVPFDDIVRSFLGTDKTHGAFAPFLMNEGLAEVDEAAEEFKKVFQATAKLVDFKSVHIVPDESEYRIDAELDLLPLYEQNIEASYTLRPLLSTTKEPLELSSKHSVFRVSFAPLKLEQISALFVFEGKDENNHCESTILVCPRDRFKSSEAPLEKRSSALLDAILAAHDGSLSLYIAHAFGVVESVSLGGDQQVPMASGGLKGVTIGPALYERLLEKAYSEPSTIRRAEYLLSLIPPGIDDVQVKKLKAMVGAFLKVVS